MRKLTHEEFIKKFQNSNPCYYTIKILEQYQGNKIKISGCDNNQAIKSFNKTVKHDNIKNNYCKTHNIKLIRIDYKNFKNIENILYKKILHTFN